MKLDPELVAKMVQNGATIGPPVKLEKGDETETSKRPKYGNKMTTVNGITFHSRREARRYGDLLILQKHGKIKNLEVQKKYVFTVNGVKICTYKADFDYDEQDGDGWRHVTEDVKGYPNDRWAMKKRLFEALFGYKIKET